jgi:hypothetical protein
MCEHLSNTVQTGTDIRGVTRNAAKRAMLIAPVVALLLFGAASAAPPAGRSAEAVTISNVKVEIKEVTSGSYKGNKYLRIHYTATPNQSIAPKMRIKIRGVVKTSGGTFPDDITSLIGIDTMAVGESKTHNSPLFMSKGLPGDPQTVELTFSLARILDKRGDYLSTFCWSGNSVRAGSCR